MKFNQNTKRAITGHLRDFIIIIIVGNFVAFLFNPDFSNFWGRLWMNSLYGLLIGGTLWKGNQFLGWLISCKIDVNKNPYKTLRWSLVSMLLYTIVAIFIVNYIWYVLIYDSTLQQMFKWGYASMIIEFVITVIITSIYFSIGFFKPGANQLLMKNDYKKKALNFNIKRLKIR
ncbi:MAG: hypothetical protein R2750_12965 [Bacteroidales bacterium]